METNQSNNRTVLGEVCTPNSLLKECSPIGWKFLGGPGWSRHIVSLSKSENMFYKNN